MSRLSVSGREKDRDLRRLGRYAVLGLLVIVGLVFGTWGFARARPGSPVWNLNDFYRALQLFPLHSGDVKDVHWQLEVARFAAAAVALFAVLGATAILARGLRKRTRLLRLSNHVIVCGAGVHGSRLTENLVQQFDVVVVDPDAHAPRFQEPRRRRELRLVLNAVHREALRQAGIGRAAKVVAVAGDDFINSQIVSTIRAVAQQDRVRGELEVFVQIEDPFLARFLEEDRHHPPERFVPAINVFSANAIAAGALFGEGCRPQLNDRRSELTQLERQERPHLLLVGDHPLLDAVALATLRRLRARRESQPDDDSLAPFRITLVGANAVARVEQLVQRWLPEPELLDLEPHDTTAHDEQSILADRWFHGRGRPGHAIVACEEELDGVGMTLAISRTLTGTPVTRVTTQPRSELDRHLEERATESRGAPITVISIADLAWGEDRSAIARMSIGERLVEMLMTEAGVPESDARRGVRELLEQRRVALRRDSAPRITVGTRGLTNALLAAATSDGGQRADIPLSALVATGLTVDLESHQNLRRAAESLEAARDWSGAFVAWSEYTRYLPPAVALDHDQAPMSGLGRDIVRLRAAALGASEYVQALRPEPATCRAAARIAIFVGAAEAISERAGIELRRLLGRAFIGYDGLILTAGTSTAVLASLADAVPRAGCSIVVYGPPGTATMGGRARYTRPGASGTRERLAMWADIAAAGFPFEEVRVVALAGGEFTTCDVLLARALGAEVVWLDPGSESNVALEDQLPNGTEHVLELIADPMTLRAFLVWPPRDGLEDALRESIARYLHQDYRERHRKEKPPDDPALAPWERLVPVLQRSNLAAADDIPNKLAVIGKRIVPGGPRLEMSRDEVELLAEMEHGRFTYERLSSGWQVGRRHVMRMVSPYLKPWNELDDIRKQSDRDAVRNIAEALDRVGYGVEDVLAPVAATPSPAAPASA